VRVAVIVPGDIHRSVTIEKFAAETNNNGPTLHFSLKNEGNVSADVDTRVPLTDMFGNVVYKNGGQYAVIADTNFDVNYDIDYRPFWGGWYKAKVFIAYDKRAGIFGTNDKAQLLYAESPEVVIFLWPSLWFFVLLGVLLLGTVGAIVWRRGRRQRGKSRAKVAPKQSSTQPMWELYVVKKNETLEQLAKKRGTSVNKVALLNRLTAPYEVAAGQKIYLPKRK
jgi:LysM repeat protein